MTNKHILTFEEFEAQDNGLLNLKTDIPLTVINSDDSDDIEVNEGLGEGKQLEGKILSDTSVGDWVYDFDLGLEDFPKYDKITHKLHGEIPLSEFTANMISVYLKETWDAIRSKKYIQSHLHPYNRKIRRKLSGFLGSKKNLEQIKIEIEYFKEFVDKLNNFISTDKIKELILSEATNITLSTNVKANDSLGEEIKTLVGKYLTFGHSWKRAVTWLIGNLANNQQSVQWLDGVVYKPLKLGTGIYPDINYVFDKFITKMNVASDVPNIGNSASALNYACEIIIKESINIPKNSPEGWSKTLNSTYLFGLHQSLLIIGTIGYVYDLVTASNIMGIPAGLKIQNINTNNITSIQQPQEKSYTNRHNEQGIKITKNSLNPEESQEIISLKLDSPIYNELLDKLVSLHKFDINSYESTTGITPKLNMVRNTLLSYFADLSVMKSSASSIPTDLSRQLKNDIVINRKTHAITMKRYLYEQIF